MKKIVSGLILLFASFAAFCQSDKTACSLTEVEEDGHLVRKGEMNYLNGNYKELRLSIQFQMSDNNMYVCIGMDLQDEDMIGSDNLAYIQFEDGKECVLTPDIVRKDKSGKRTECKFLVATKDEPLFIASVMSGVFFSTKEHPQIEIIDLNRYTARKFRERFECAYSNLKK